MNGSLRTIFLAFSFFIFFTSQAQRSTVLFDDDWLFHRGGALGADETSVSDTSWKSVQLPHDWSIEDLPGTNSPFNAAAISQVSGGFTTGGTGWYRKWFVVPAAEKDKRFYLQFDGVYMNADVYVNGKSMGRHPYGYTSFYYDITDRLKFGDKNLVAVRIRNEGENSRWYSGSGIYRHVWLTSVNPLHVAVWGTQITCSGISTKAATVQVITKLRNNTAQSAQTNLVLRIVNAKGAEVAKANKADVLPDSSSKEINQSVLVRNPDLWSVEAPHLYTAIVDVYNNEKLVDSYKTSFGIRSISFDAVHGFQLNGKPLKLKGGCVHHDNGPLGARAYDRAEERKVALLKESGYNAIRCAHNPPSPAFLDACDRLGMLVLDEAFDTWQQPKNQFDYNLYFNDWWQRDIDNMVLRDRNHPSVIMWSIGNEIPNRDKPEVAAVAKKLSAYVHQMDATRPVTCGVNGVEENKDLFFAALDVAGYNYAPQKYQQDHERLPKRVIYASESFALDAFDYWMGVVDHPWVIGDFVWTAFDYIGEASIGWLGYPQTQAFFPWTLAYCGDLDICGWKRPQSFYRDALWKENALAILVTAPRPTFDTNTHRAEWSRWHWKDETPSWNWEGYEQKPLPVSVYSSCERVELFLNGKSLGQKITNRSTKFTATWQVPYEAGALKAIGYKGKKKVGEVELKTAAQAKQTRLSADRKTIKADGQDLAYITVELTDEQGIRNPKAEDLLRFDVSGPAKIVGVGNANPTSLESYQQPQRKAWQGRCLVILKSEKEGGEIGLKVKADNFPEAEIKLISR